MKLQSGKIAKVPMEGTNGSGECVGGDESAGLGKRKKQRSNYGVCSPEHSESELRGGVSRDVKTYEKVRGECSKGNRKRKKLSCWG